MRSLGGWSAMVGAALLVCGCGVGGGDSLRPVGAVTVAQAPREVREKMARRRRPGGAGDTASESLLELEAQPGFADSGPPAAPPPEVARPTRPLASEERFPQPQPQPQPPPPSSEPPSEVEKLYRDSCGACHSLDLVEHHRLEREQWEWVLEDMAELYGVNWIRPKQRQQLLDYLSENLGPDTK